MTQEVATEKSDRFWIEKRPLDFPFYNDPDAGKRELGLLALGAGLAILLCFMPPVGEAHLRFLRSISYFLLPFVPMCIALKGHLGGIYKRLVPYDLVIIIVGVIVTFFLSLSLAVLGSVIGIIDPATVKANPAVYADHNLVFWISVIVQIMGEELIKFSIFLFTLTLMYKKTGRRKLGIIVATIVTCVIFGVMHLTAYGNLGQVILVQGGSATVSVYQYIRTKNILVTYATHFLFDAYTFLVTSALLAFLATLI